MSISGFYKINTLKTIVLKQYNLMRWDFNRVEVFFIIHDTFGSVAHLVKWIHGLQQNVFLINIFVILCINVWYGWLLADTRPYLFIYKEDNKFIISSAPPPPPTLLTYLYCWHWANFTMEPNGQNQHFTEVRQKVCSSIHYLVHQRGLPSLNSKLERFVTKKMKKSGCDIPT